MWCRPTKFCTEAAIVDDLTMLMSFLVRILILSLAIYFWHVVPYVD